MPRKDKTEFPVRRAALYIRVSTEEQAKQGYSIPAQRAALEEYAKRNGYAVAGVYIDEGKSARKRYTARTEFMRMLNDVKSGKIDVILFIKLDRWFRSVADYYEVQKILDAHGVQWKTTQENYDTETTNGKLYINIRLSVAQDESDRDSDRIKFIFRDKVARGETIFGNPPVGLMSQDKRLVHDPETVQMVRDIFSHYSISGSISDTLRKVGERYGKILWLESTRRMLRNPIYKGEYRGNPNYCEPIIAPEEFDRIQEMLQERSIRHNQTGRVYLFSGLVICAECGKRMTARYILTKRKSGTREYHLYRCPRALQYHVCTHRKEANEEKLEQWLLKNIERELERYQVTWETEQKRERRRPELDRGILLGKLERLKDLYINDLITMEQYRADYAKFQQKLAELDAAVATEREPNFAHLKTLLSGGTGDLYTHMTAEQRRSFWRGIVSEIRLDADNNPQIFFCL